MSSRALQPFRLLEIKLDPVNRNRPPEEVAPERIAAVSGGDAFDSQLVDVSRNIGHGSSYPPFLQW